MNVHLTLRDARRAIELTVASATAEAFLAALSANPETFEELETALGRYAHPSVLSGLLNLPPQADFGNAAAAGVGDSLGAVADGTRQDGHDDRLVIDLPARWVGFRGTPTEFPPSHSEDVTYLDADDARNVVLRYRLDESWCLEPWTVDWPRRVADRRAARATMPPCDDRERLYADLPDFLAVEAWHARAEQGASSVRIAREIARTIHENWLLTPRPSLAGASPRDVLLRQRGAIEQELSARAWEWSVIGQCPPPLPVGSRAVREGGVGTHEFVLYYDLVRQLLELALGEVWPPGIETACGLAHWLATELDQWLDTADTELLHGRTPRQVIEEERRRIPFAVTSEEAIVDHDCPICRMMAEQHSGPVFCHLDCSNMDEGFAFSLYETRAEWEEEETAWNDYFRRNGPPQGVPALDGPWRNSYFRNEGLADMAPAQQVGVRQFQLLAYLSELREDVSDSPSLRALVDQAVRRMEDFRQSLGEQPSWAADTALDDCAALVSELCQGRDELAEKCSQVCRALQLLRQTVEMLPMG